MRNYHKLLELKNNGCQILINFRRYNDSWNIDVQKEAEGIKFGIDKDFDDLDEGIGEIHAQWEVATKAMPDHRLTQLEYKPED